METNRENIIEALKVLKQAGYFVDNLWTVDDVQDRYECDEDTAQSILYDALTNEYIVQEIFSQIIDYAECEGLKGKE